MDNAKGLLKQTHKKFGASSSQKLKNNWINKLYEINEISNQKISQIILNKSWACNFCQLKKWLEFFHRKRKSCLDGAMVKGIISVMVVLENWEERPKDILHKVKSFY